MEIGVLFAAGGGEVPDDLFVLHTPQGHDVEGHGVDHGCGVLDFAAVALRVPAVTPFGRVVGVVVEESRNGVVDAVDIIEGDTDGLSSEGSEAGQREREKNRQQTYHRRLKGLEGLFGEEVPGRASEKLCDFVQVVEIVFGWTFGALHLTDETVGYTDPDCQICLRNVLGNTLLANCCADILIEFAFRFHGDFLRNFCYKDIRC